MVLLHNIYLQHGSIGCSYHATSDSTYLTLCILWKDILNVIGVPIVDIVSIEEELTASDVLAEKSRLLDDDWGVSLFVSVEETWYIKMLIKLQYIDIVLSFTYTIILKINYIIFIYTILPFFFACMIT